METSGVREHDHHQNGYDSADKKIRLAAAEAVPCPIGILSDKRLDDHSHQRRKDPEERELVGISAECRENAADVGTLQSVSYLHAEEPETQVPHLPE